MKKITAALAAILLVFALSACQPADPQPAPAEAPARELEPSFVQDEAPDDIAPDEQTPAGAEQTPAKQLEPQIDTQSGEDAPDYTGQFSDEPLTLAADIEEVVSYSIRVPQVTLDSADASQYINSGFAELADSLIRYAQETVYKSAQEKQTIGFLDADYTIAIDGAQLCVELTLTERYAGEDTVSESCRTYLFDAATGERIITE